MASNSNRGRLTVDLSPCADRAPGLRTIGTVKRGDGGALALGVNDAGEYFAFRQGEKPEPLPLVKVQAAIAALKTGMSAPSQAERMAANAERKRLNAEKARQTGKSGDVAPKTD